MSISEGSRVRYSAAYLRSTGQQTGEAPFGKGTVTKLVPLGKGSDVTVLADITWDAGFTLPSRVNVKNLEKC